jgi:hypothetical protein
MFGKRKQCRGRTVIVKSGRLAWWGWRLMAEDDKGKGGRKEGTVRKVLQGNRARPRRVGAGGGAKGMEK